MSTHLKIVGYFLSVKHFYTTIYARLVLELRHQVGRDINWAINIDHLGVLEFPGDCNCPTLKQVLQTIFIQLGRGPFVDEYGACVFVYLG